MKNELRIKDTNEFNLILTTGKKIINENFIIYYKEKKNNSSRFGITFAKKFGHAVIRNKFKRILREIIRKNENVFSNKFDYIIIIRKSCLNLNFFTLQDSFLNLIKGE